MPNKTFSQLAPHRVRKTAGPGRDIIWYEKLQSPYAFSYPRYPNWSKGLGGIGCEIWPLPLAVGFCQCVEGLRWKCLRVIFPWWDVFWDTV